MSFSGVIGIFPPKIFFPATTMSQTSASTEEFVIFPMSRCFGRLKWFIYRNQRVIETAISPTTNSSIFSFMLPTTSPAFVTPCHDKASRSFTL